MLGLCWAYLGPIWRDVGPMLGQFGAHFEGHETGPFRDLQKRHLFRLEVSLEG